MDLVRFYFASGIGSALKEPVNQDTVLLTGASSQLGVFLIPRLLAGGFRVLAMSRNASRYPQDSQEGLLWIHPDELSHGAGEATSGLSRQVKMLVSCGPMELATQAMGVCAALERVVVFSTSSVFSKAGSPDSDESEQIEGILRGERELKACCEQAGLALLCLRPTLIYGCGLDRNISRLAAWIRQHGWMVVAGQARGLRQPVHADDLAKVVIRALSAEKPLTLDSPACGGSTLSYRHMVELIFDSLGKPRRIIKVPAGILAPLTGFLAKLPTFGGLNREMVRRQNIDLVFDDKALRQALDYNPRPFRPEPRDYEIPPEAMNYRLSE